MSGKKMGPDGAIMLVPEIVANGAMTSLDVSNNDIRGDGGKALFEALKGNNQVMKEINIAGNNLHLNATGNNDMSGVIAIGDAIPTIGAMTTITFGDKQAVTMMADMTKADLSGNELGASGAIIAAAFLPKCQ